MEAENLSVAIVQYDISWNDPTDNFAKIEKLLSQALNVEIDLIVLPEMFNTGFSMQPESIFEELDGNSVGFMKQLASKYNCSVMGSLIVRQDGKFYNRSVLVESSGYIQQYNKRHLFTHAGENKEFTSGVQRVVFELKGWRIFPQICYDLRFPVWGRNNLNYDALIYVANWPKSRRKAWKTLLKARAIENQAYVIACNRVGTDGNGIDYSGDSAVIDFYGRKLKTTKKYKSDVIIQILSKPKLEEYRMKYQFLNDIDDFNFN